MRLWCKILATALGVLIGLPLLCAIALYASALYHRWRAEQLLADMKTMRVGVTTQAEYERVLQPLAPHLMPLEDSPENYRPDSYGVTSQPLWFWHALQFLPESAMQMTSHWSVSQGTMLMTYPDFSNGRLTRLTLHIMQGEGHPFGGTVVIDEGQRAKIEPWFGQENFDGYWVRQTLIGARVHNSFVMLDERATAEERRRALDIRFDCFTAFLVCIDGRRMLNPVPMPVSQP